MLSSSKKRILESAISDYQKKYLGKKYVDLDESGVRIMVNDFLSDVLGFLSIEEIKTEYMIRGTYADYMLEMKGKRYFLVEVKKASVELSQNQK